MPDPAIRLLRWTDLTNGTLLLCKGGKVNTLRDADTSAAGDAVEALDPDALRDAMVGELREMGALRTDRVIAAVGAVPRHAFAPEASLTSVYDADRPVPVKWDESGKAVSLLSAAHIQVVMLEQARVEPGTRVLEIGSGGYNAALLAELVGDAGQVTTVDIDPDIVERARGALAAAGYGHVNVVLADAEAGVAEHAPYDRVIVTASTWDIPPAWWRQLSPGGRIVVPLRMRGLTRSVAFDANGGRLVSGGYCLCSFVTMQGAGARTEPTVALDGTEVRLRVEAEDAGGFDTESLRDALLGPRVERWSGVVFDQVDEMDLWVMAGSPEFGLLVAVDGPIQRGLVARSATQGAPTLVRAGSFAYRTKRPIEGAGEEAFETGVFAHGPDAGAVAEEYVELLRTWDRKHRRGPGARIEAYPAGTPDADLPPGRVLDKTHTRIVISWP